MKQQLEKSELNEVLVQFVDPRKPLKTTDMKYSLKLIEDAITVDRDYYERIMKSLRQLPTTKIDIDVVAY